MVVPAQLVSLFTHPKLCHFAANRDQPFTMMTRIAFMDEPRRHSEKPYGSLLAGKRADVFYLCGSGCCGLSVGHVEFCWRECERLIPRRIVGFARHNIFHEDAPVIAGVSTIMLMGTASVGDRLLIEFSCGLNCNHEKRRWLERSVFSAPERCANRQSWLRATAGLQWQFQKQVADIAPEAGDNLSLDELVPATIAMIVCNSLIASVDLFVTSCCTFWLAAQLSMNWQSLLLCVFDFLDSPCAIGLLKTSVRSVGWERSSPCLVSFCHLAPDCWPGFIPSSGMEGPVGIVEPGLDSSAGVWRCTAAL
jgi:hypothetical protein